jgi:hypothetical protein
MGGICSSHGSTQMHSNCSWKFERKKYLERPRRRWESKVEEVARTGFICHRIGSSGGIL